MAKRLGGQVEVGPATTGAGASVGAEAAQAQAVEVEGAAIDSRQVRPGQLFVALVAERDGHDFVGAAVANGAAASLVERPSGPGPAVVVVGDTTAALTELGRYARERLGDATVVGVTGSVGKTSTKDLLAAVLSVRMATGASDRSHNNELGVPLTLLNAPPGAKAVVVEMGARGPGHIAQLCDVARPQVGVVTTVGAAHTEMFGTVAEVARAKGELVERLPVSGLAVLNADDILVSAMASRTVASVIRYGSGGDVSAVGVELDDDLRARFHLESDWGSAVVHLGVSGAHNVANALAAAAVALHLGMAPEEVADGLSHARLSPWRMELVRLPSGGVVLNDAYNANPMSMASALHALASVPAQRRVAVLGFMAELGPGAGAEHTAVAALAAELGVEVVACGTELYGTEPVADVDAAAARLGTVGPGMAVLVKGSRVAGLEKLAHHLAG